MASAAIAISARRRDSPGWAEWPSAQNSILEQMLVSIQSLLRSWITRVREAATDHGPSYRDHVPILAAIEKGDVAAARAAMRSHLTNAGERLKTSYSQPVKR
jgi:GntR family transcriptional regulator, transcriptional repressor for pyruvate dehydrogenase complex